MNCIGYAQCVRVYDMYVYIYVYMGFNVHRHALQPLCVKLLLLPEMVLPHEDRHYSGLTAT